MTKILDWKRAEDPRDVIHLAVQALAEGHLVAFPAESHYVIAANGLRLAAVDNLRAVLDDCRDKSSSGKLAANASPVALVPRSSRELPDYIPEVSSVGMRLADRLWPGSVQLRIRTDHRDSLLTRLPTLAQALIVDSRGYCSFAMPRHESFDEVMRLSVGPLLVANPLTWIGTGNSSEALQQADGRVALAIDDGFARSALRWTVVRVDGLEACVEQQGGLSAEDVVSRTQFKILLVCTGNTCRSPMAQQLLRKKLKMWFPKHFSNSQLSPIDVLSAGISAYPGGPASDGAIAAMKSLGMDLARHESQPTTQALVDDADLILTMTNSHRHSLLGRWPHLASKTFGLAPHHGDVSDPYGGSLEIYQECARKMDEYLEAWIAKLDRDTLPIWSVTGTSGCV